MKKLPTAPETPHTGGESQMTGNRNEPIACGRENMHPKSYQAEMMVERASMDQRVMKQPPVRTDKFKG